MSYQGRTASTLERVQTLTTYLLREPVKEVVREALHEEAAVVSTETDKPDNVSESKSKTETEMPADMDAESSSKLPLGVLVLAGVGAAYLARRRRDSGEADYSQDRFEEEQHGVDSPETEPSVPADEEDESVTSV